jgi:hypothetical protein
MPADDRLTVIARHLGAARNNVNPSVVRHFCSSETVQGGVALPSAGPANDARKPRNSKVQSVIPKNRYECLFCVCFVIIRGLLNRSERQRNSGSIPVSCNRLFSCSELLLVPPRATRRPHFSEHVLIFKA